MAATMRRMCAVLAAAVLLGACENGTTEPGDGAGEVSFTFSGDTAGTFVAAGTITRGNALTGTYAAGAIENAPQGRFLAVIGQRTTGRAGVVDGILLGLEAPAEGTFACTDEAAADCPIGITYATGLEAAGEEMDALFLSTAASVTITSLGSRRVRGSFTATLEEVEFDAPRRIQVSGTFDVPLLSEWGS